MSPRSRPRRTYDHRLREHLSRNGVRPTGRGLDIPRSTIATWKQRGLRPVFTTEEFGIERQQLVERIRCLQRRVRILAAVVRLLLSLRRASGFTLTRERLPEGRAKASILRALASTEDIMPLPLALRVLGLAPSRYHAWRRADVRCALDDRPSCPRTTPGRLTAIEIAAAKEMVLAPEHRHMPLATLAVYAQRLGRVFASATTWARLVRERGWRRPRLRVHPAKPKVGIRASRSNEVWHIDVTVLKLLDGTKAYVHAVIDNYSRKILAWAVAARLEPAATCNVLLDAGKHLVDAAVPTVYADAGVENVNSVVDATLAAACLNRVLAQVDVAFSNSMIEAWWRALKHQWLYLNSLDSIERLRPLIEFFVRSHNTEMPHRALCGRTPDETFFGSRPNLPDELAAARNAAIDRRLATNRASSCGQCAAEPSAKPAPEIPP